MIDTRNSICEWFMYIKNIKIIIQPLAVNYYFILVQYDSGDFKFYNGIIQLVLLAVGR